MKAINEMHPKTKRRVLMFCPAMVPGVESGNKRHTIRTNAHCEPGYVLSLRRWAQKPYRSKHVVIREAVCTNVLPVMIDGIGIIVSGYALDPAEAEIFAHADGFNTFDEMIDFFRRTHGLPFFGSLIEWQNPEHS